MQFLIQGLFFQNRQVLGLACSVEGNAAVLYSGLFQFMFAGLIWTDKQSALYELTGDMLDHFGRSRLSEVQVTDLEVKFTKRYKGREDDIFYTFKVRDGDSWVGEYRGDRVGSGTSRCIITEVPDSFFEPQSVMALLGRGTAHKW